MGHEQKQISSIERFIIQITGYVSEVMSKWRDWNTVRVGSDEQ